MHIRFKYVEKNMDINIQELKSKNAVVGEM